MSRGWNDGMHIIALAHLLYLTTQYHIGIPFSVVHQERGSYGFLPIFGMQEPQGSQKGEWEA